ncbi:MAG: recombinase family protein, partial [Gemmataceae bacterium]
MSRSKQLGLVYLRRSTEKQEISLTSQLEWALTAAARLEVPLDASLEDLKYMQAKGLSCHKAIYLDDGISGSDLTRPGFLKVNEDALKNRSVSHLFIYKRDRFARPQDAMRVALVEKTLLEAGVTLIFSDGDSKPYLQGQSHIVQDLGLVFGYYQSGEELRKHADRVLGFQRRLAEQGYRTGGNPPYGFVRVLVNAEGKILEELPPGKVVQQPGCHVRVVPKDMAKITVWLEILTLKDKGWGAKRIAQHLNDRGIPSPDAGRTRTDHGVKHRVSGRWNHNTVIELCRNPIITGVQRYGRRSEGRLRRLGAAEPRLLEEKDLTAEGKARIIFNEPELQIQRQVGEAHFAPERWEKIQAGMDRRGRVQRDIPRSKDPGRYPLACRLVDLTEGCGSILYARTTHNRAVYTCGRYMKTSGSDCHSNQVDGEAMLRFTLMTIRQQVENHGGMDRLREKLLARARASRLETGPSQVMREVTRLQSELANLRNELQQVEYRLAREKEDAIYEALKRQYATLRADIRTTEESLRKLESQVESRAEIGPEVEVEGALGLLADVERITANPEARQDINPMLAQLGIRIGLRFGPDIKGKKREVRRLLGGVMAFGESALPLPLFGKDNAEEETAPFHHGEEENHATSVGSGA